mmetsp:Transcript_30305/g.84695  ORF Transcript_30305/g.84695 Transcript_30305/m.84695 type:complete len:88 (-) Transcript_30305:12-275(-)
MSNKGTGSVILKEGYLHKKGGGKRRSNWTKRWFVLYPNHIDYFDDRSKKILKGSIPVDGSIHSFNVRPFSSKSHAFAVILPQREFVI